MGFEQQYSERLGNVRALMKRSGLDFLVVGPSADLVYLTGANHRPSERFAALLLPQQGPASIVVPAFEAASLPALPSEVAVRTWGESDNPTHLAAGIIAESIHAEPGGADVTIGVGERLWAIFLLRLQAELPRAGFTPATAVLSQARLVKTAAEINLLAKAGALADAAFLEIIKQPFAGRREIDVSFQFAKLMEAGGLTVSDTPIVGSGPNGASPHHHAGTREIQRGDAVVLDFFGTYEGYFADCTRTVWVGSAPEPGSEEINVYNTVMQAQEAGVQSARPGMTCEGLDAVARDVISQAGYGEYFTHRLGHGIGLDGHEPPYLVQGNDTVLQDGMAFSVEPGIYLPGRFGVRIEDSVALVNGAALRFNNTDRGIVVVS
jgi:Xaa-Pro aminopeptidase